MNQKSLLLAGISSPKFRGGPGSWEWYFSLFRTTILIALFLFSCQEEDAPTGSNQIQIGSTTNVTVTYYTAHVSSTPGSVKGNKIIQHGHCWGTSANPTINDNKTSQGSLNEAKTITSQLQNLTPSTNYFVRSYLTTVYETIYGSDTSFKTKETASPSVTTTPVTGITLNTANSGGDITDDGGLQVTVCGIVWNTTGNPDLNNKTGYSNNDGGPSSFTSQLSGLTEGTTYYVRAYATNSKGTNYGNQVSFTAISFATVTTTAVTTFTATSAVLGGNVINEGSTAVSERGIVYSTTPAPTTANSKVAMGSGPGSFSGTVTRLQAGTTYYVRAYATNITGTAYGDPEVSFKTPDSPYGIEMVTIQGGTFQMGSTTGYSDEQPVHSVTLSSFQIGKTEVTQVQWEAVMGSNPSYFKGADLPVEQVSWNDIQTFITKLNQQTGSNYRLPSEAEWEFAARGGISSKGYTYSGSNTVGDVAWYWDNSSSATHSVGQKPANELGLYDMSGNVWEWCSDWYGAYNSAAQTNPTGPASGSSRVFRGGNWTYDDGYCRVADRNYGNPGIRYSSIGFRLARSL